MQLLHYTDQPVSWDRDRIYLQDFPRQFGKPEGLWVSVAGEDDWPSWCQENDYGIYSLAHVSEVTLTPCAQILFLSTAQQLLDFHSRYAVQTEFERAMVGLLPDEFLVRQRPIDWRTVASDYEGIVIAPYQWDLRLMGPAWYYTIDCSSGCIWSMRAIASFSAHTVAEKS